MMVEKLRHGFLHVLTETGLHYVKPSLWERICLLWVFRNFSILPQQVLSAWQQRMAADLCSEKRLFHYWGPQEDQRGRLIGTLVMSVLPAFCQHESRAYSRGPVQFEVRYGQGRDLIAGQGCELGGGGLSLIGPKSYPPGTELQLRYRLPSQPEWTAVRGLVRHSNGERMGVAFLNFGTPS